MLGSLHQSGEKVVAVIGALVAMGTAAAGIIDGRSVFTIVATAAVAGVLAMVFAGVLRQFWAGDEVEEAELQGPGNTAGRVKFGKGLRSTRTAIQELNRSTSQRFDDVNRRLYDLERHVFKDGKDLPDRQE